MGTLEGFPSKGKLSPKVNDEVESGGIIASKHPIRRLRRHLLLDEESLKRFDFSTLNSNSYSKQYALTEKRRIDLFINPPM